MRTELEIGTRFYSWLDRGHPGFDESVPRGYRPTAFEWHDLDVLLGGYEHLEPWARDNWHLGWANAFGCSPALFRARVHWLQDTGRMLTKKQCEQRAYQIETSTRRLTAIHAVAARTGMADAVSTYSENKVERRQALLRLAVKKRLTGKSWAQIAREVGYSRNYLWRLRTTIGLALNLR